MLGRLIAHVLSGVVFFASYAEGKNVWLYSLGYNGTYMVPEMVVTSILLLPLALVFKPRQKA